MAQVNAGNNAPNSGRDLVSRLGSLLSGQDWKGRQFASLKAMLGDAGIAFTMQRRSGSTRFIPYLSTGNGAGRSAAALNTEFARTTAGRVLAEMPSSLGLSPAERRAAVLLRQFAGQAGRMTPRELRSAMMSGKATDIPFTTRDEMRAFLSLALPGATMLNVKGQVMLGKLALVSGSSRAETERRMVEMVFNAHARRGLKPGAAWGDTVDEAMSKDAGSRARALSDFFVYDPALAKNSPVLERDKNLLRGSRLSSVLDPAVLAMVFAPSQSNRNSLGAKVVLSVNPDDRLTSSVSGLRRPPVVEMPKAASPAEIRRDDIVVIRSLEPDPTGALSAMEVLVPSDRRSGMALRDIAVVAKLDPGVYPKENARGIPVGYLRVDEDGAVTHLDTTQTVEHNAYGPSYMPPPDSDGIERYKINGKIVDRTDIVHRLNSFASFTRGTTRPEPPAPVHVSHPPAPSMSPAFAPAP